LLETDIEYSNFSLYITAKYCYNNAITIGLAAYRPNTIGLGQPNGWSEEYLLVWGLLPQKFVTPLQF
jgi:hypothetical protein